MNSKEKIWLLEKKIGYLEDYNFLLKDCLKQAIDLSSQSFYKEKNKILAQIKNR